ncbi:GCN5 N-acetyltransferase [Trichoderma parareesei]|uniref:GCN5 N-acetyltransferase n=1 Tax=Trichoderma parareesei TaxID=858221 RepID=A0A2H2YV20_TRIPA|nr:GCN5 N-acetyltransferase [Trichoderma parareesei]
MPVIASKPDFIIQSASSLNQVKDLWWSRMRDLGWNRDELDANTHFTVARHGEDWLLLVPTGSIEPSGMVIGFTYPNQTGWVGFFIMNERYRGRGWGAALFKAMLDTYQKNGIHTVGLDAVQEQVNTYARRGFVEAARIKLMTRVSAHEVPISYADKQPKQGHRVTDIREVDARAMASLDHAHTGLYRPALWTEEALFSRPDAFGFAILSEASDDLQGLILIRRCEHGHRVGPLIADCTEHASLLLQLAMSHQSILTSTGSLIAETFGPNEYAARVFSDLGWQWAGLDYHRMWLEGRVPIEQQEGGKGPRGMFAVFDAGQG